MKLHCFICASLLYSDDEEHDQSLHVDYLKRHLEGIPCSSVALTVIQNGCRFPTFGVGIIRNPIVKSVAYNWLLCDAKCQEDYWLFLPEDCYVKPKGWHVLQSQMESRRDCFALSRDPKAIVCRQGVFGQVSKEIQTLSDMNFLGK